MTESDTRSFTFAALLILVASGARYGVELGHDRERLSWDTASALPELLEATRSELHREAARRTPLAPDERIDPNTASADQLDRLPGLGPAVAKAVVEDRQNRGPFSSVEDLTRVRGIGPATVEKIRGHLALRPSPVGGTPRRSGRRIERSGSPGSTGRVNLNRADTVALQGLPGVGPALARRIVEARSRLGGFTSVDQLTAVRGIGAATVERLRPHVRLRR